MKQCWHISLIVFALLLLLKVSSIECQTPPYSLTITNRDINQLTLQCTDDFGNPISNAVFFRNGILNTSDECFNSSVSVPTNKLRFTISPECEGLFTCGGSYGNGVVLSKPITIYGEYVSLPFPISVYSKIITYLFTAYPERTSDYNGTQQSLRVVAGTSITLPCHVQISALHGYTVKWKIEDPVKNTHGEHSEPHNSDYSLTLTNLSDSMDSCKYHYFYSKYYIILFIVIYTCQVQSQIFYNGPYKIDGQKTKLYVIEYSKYK